jgi:hypothetical protein
MRHVVRGGGSMNTVQRNGLSLATLDPSIVRMIEASLRVRGVSETVEVLAKNVMPPLSYETVDSIRRRMVKRRQAPFATRPYIRATMSGSEDRALEYLDALRLQDAREGSRKLAEAIDDYYYAEAVRRKTTTQAMSLVLNYSRAELERMAGAA